MDVFRYVIGVSVLCLCLMGSVKGRYNKATFLPSRTISSQSCIFNETENSKPVGWNIYRILDIDSSYVLLGSREQVYLLDEDLTLIQSVSLTLDISNPDYRACSIVNSDDEAYVCQNYITFGYFKNATEYRVCGTYNSESPRCYDCTVEGSCSTGNPVENMPRRPQQNFTSTIPISVGSDSFYFVGGLLDHYSGTPLFSKVDVPSGAESVKTDDTQSHWLQGPTNFVGQPMEYHGHIYFIYREKAEEYSNIGNVIYSRVGRVCKNDTGGLASPLAGNFLTFLKARLTCSVGTEFPFFFDMVQDTVRVEDTNVFYGLFTTTSGGTASSAICRYDLEEIEALFNEDFRRGQETSDKMWLKVEPKHDDDNIATRTCGRAYNINANSIYAHLEKYPLLNTNVLSCGFDQSCTYSRGLDERADALAVLEGVRGREFAIYDSSDNSVGMYIGTNDAKILNVSIDADGAEVLGEIYIERQTFNDTYLDQRWPFGVSDITYKDGRVYATMDQCAFYFDVGVSLPSPPSTIKYRTDMYNNRNCIHRNLDNSVTNCFLVFEGEAGTEMEAVFNSSLPAEVYSVNSKRFYTAQGCREFLHVHITISDDTRILSNENPGRTDARTYDGFVEVSSATGKTVPIMEPFPIDVDLSAAEACDSSEVFKYDYEMAVYRYEFKLWLTEHVTCSGDRYVCPSPQSCNPDV